jgi:hypothetical protein
MSKKSAAAPAIVNRRTIAIATHHEQLIPGFGNVTAQDMIVPRLKLLQGLSPEVKENPRQFIQGEFYHSVLGDMLGESIRVVPLQVMRTIELWAPRDSNEGLLARSLDGKSWDKPNQEFTVRLKSGRKAVWKTLGSVGESGLGEFGTSEPGNPKSPPAASLTYRTALYMPDHSELSPCLMISSRMATRAIQDLITRVNARHIGGTAFYAQQYQLVASKQQRGPNEFYVPAFRNEGNITDSALLAHLESLASTMATINVRTSDDRLEEGEEERENQAGNTRY